MTLSKKIFFSAAFAVALLIAFTLIYKDYLFKRLFTSYLENALHGSCSISSTNVSLSYIKINDFSFSNPDYEVNFKRASLTFAFSGRPLINISSLRLEDGKALIINFDNLKRQFTASSPQNKAGETPVGFSGISLYLKDISLESENLNNTRVALKISLALHVKNGADLSISDIVISDFDAESDGFHLRVPSAAGNLFARLRENRLTDIKGGLTDNSGGLINIKNESSLDFLRRYMDEPSFKALVDNFKNYTYNIGTVAVRKQDRDVILEADFDSPVMGHRDIVIDFHEQLSEVRR